MDLQTIQTETTTYRVTEAGRALVGKTLPTRKPIGRMPAPARIVATAIQTAIKYHGRLLAAISAGQGPQHAHYIGRTDNGWILKATDGIRGAFECGFDPNSAELRAPVASAPRPWSFLLTPELSEAVKRAKVVSRPKPFIRLAIGAGDVVVIGNDGETSSEETVKADAQAPRDARGDCQAVTIIIDADYMIEMFGRPGLRMEVNETTAAVDVDGWRYVVSLAKA